MAPMKAVLALLLLAPSSNSREGTAVSGETLSRGPYLVEVGRTKATVCWRLESRPQKDSCFSKDGLPAGQPFLYTVPGSTQTWRARTLAPRGRKIRFAVFGDMGEGSEAQWRTARQLERWDPDFVLAAGDIVYPKGHDKDYDGSYFRPYARLLPRIPFFPAIGNHDYGYTKREKAEKRFRKHYSRIHHRPKYYSFDAGDAHFISLDSNREGYGVKAAQSLEPGSPQFKWLERDLASSKARWKIVFLHVPLYASGWHGNNKGLIQALTPLFSRHGVDIVFQGHNHHYERSKPLGGVVYVVAGSGGAELHRRWRWHRWSKKFIKDHGFVGVALDAESLSFEFVDADGAVRDRSEIRKK